MVTIYRAHGLRIVIFTDAHEPAHVYVFGDGHAKINLSGPAGAAELVWAVDTKRKERRAMAIVAVSRSPRRWRKVSRMHQASNSHLSGSLGTATACTGRIWMWICPSPAYGGNVRDQGMDGSKGRTIHFCYESGSIPHKRAQGWSPQEN